MSKKKKMDKIVVVDLEATCWDGPIPENQSQDIIEIGVCFYDIESGKIEAPKGIIVKPARSVISKYCTDLTSITQNMVDQGVTLGKAFKTLKEEYGTKSRIWASWGEWDRRIFLSHSKAYKLPYPFGDRHINVKTLYAVSRKLPKEVGVAKALEKEGLTFEGRAHRGVDDAKMIATLLGKIL